MQDQFADDSVIAEYLAESREHLATIESDLMSMEQLGAEADDELVNRVFRAAHSIKGGAGFFGLTKIRELAHKTENVLDLIRSRQMLPAPDVVSILLLAFDKLRELINNYRDSEQAEIEEFTAGLAALTTSHLQGEDKLLVDRREQIATTQSGGLIHVSSFDLTQARKGGKSIYLIRYDLIHDIERRGKTPYEVLQSLMRCGQLLETVLDLAAAGTLEDEPSNELPLEVLYATVLEPDLIGQLIEAPPEHVRVIDKDGSSRTLAEISQPAAVAVVPAAPAAPAPVVSAQPASEPRRPAQPAVARPSAPAAVQPTDTIRLNVALLDSLMNLAGELVLSRNQLNESLLRGDRRGVQASAQRVSLVTTELQELVTLTRMQPVGNVFGKFPRLVRDLGRNLGKDAELEVEGAEVEIDKTLLEGLSDPLTHMVRNAVDHGIESRQERQSAGKPAHGTVKLRACHQAGQVVIEISDDGRGLDGARIAASAVRKGILSQEQVDALSDQEKLALIFLPGVSTSAKVSDVSGRGVGMDVVKTNLARLGGKVEIESTPRRGSCFRIKLPLTLAIIPSLLVSERGERFAIPQVNVRELIRIPASQISQRIDHVGSAAVLNLRDRLVPLLHLAGALGLPPGEESGRALNVVLVDTGSFEYGLVVEHLHDTVEIVVKPLGRHLKSIAGYAGATILGDGCVALILDASGLAARAGLSAASVLGVPGADSAETPAGDEAFALLLFHNTAAEACALPIFQISRVERVRHEQIELIGGRRTMQYRGASLPVITLSDVTTLGELDPAASWVVIVFEQRGRTLGLLAAEPLDMIETHLPVDRETLRQRGVAGSAIIGKRTTLLVDLDELVDSTQPPLELEESSESETLQTKQETVEATVLLAEDSDFFRGQLKRLIEGIGCRVLAACDGQEAWELLERHADEVVLVTTDIEMPRVDGLTLTRRIRADARFELLPVIAVSTLAAEEEVARGLKAGVTEYQVKLNKDELIESIRRAVTPAANPVAARLLG